MEISEREIGQKVLEYWTRDGWDCYPECSFGSARADLVAIRDGITVFIECKTSLSVALFDQIVEWRPYANFLYVATPGRRFKKFSRVEKHLFSYYGIGHLSVEKFGIRIAEARYLRIRARERKVVLDILHPDMKNYVPGSRASDGYSTPWKRTMTRAMAYVKSHPGCSIKELVAGIEHHYSSPSSARASLFRWLEQDVRIRVQWGKTPGFYPAGKIKRSNLGRRGVVK